MIALPYIFLVLVFLLLHYYFNESRLLRINVQIETKIVYLILWFFFGFRGYIFTDCFNYASFFSGVPSIRYIFANHFLRYTWWEPGFVCYCSIIKLFTKDFFIFQLIDTTIDLVLLHKALSYFNSERALNIVVFLSMSGLVTFIDLFRNVKSILLFFYSLRFIQKREWIKYYFVCFISITFHTSALVYFICYPFLVKNINKKTFLYIGILSIVIGLLSKTLVFSLTSRIEYLFPNKIQKMVNAYMSFDNDYSTSRIISFGLLEKLITFFLIYLNFYKISKDSKSILLIKCFTLYFMMYFVFWGFNELSNRFSLLFVFSYWGLIPQIIKKQKKQNQVIYVAFIALYCLLKISLYRQPFQKYENWIIGASTYTERLNILR